MKIILKPGDTVYHKFYDVFGIVMGDDEPSRNTIKIQFEKGACVEDGGVIIDISDEIDGWLADDEYLVICNPDAPQNRLAIRLKYSEHEKHSS